MTDIVVSRQAARRYLLASQGLLSAEGSPSPWRSELSGPEGALEVIRRLKAVQLDPVAVVAPSHELVVRNRVSDAGRDWLHTLLGRGLLFEYPANARCVLPAERFPDFYPIMAQAWSNIQAHEEDLLPVIQSVREAIEQTGPSRSRELGSDGPVLRGVGWNPPEKTSKASGRALELLWLAGQIVVASREGNERRYELTARHLPEDLVHAAMRRVEASPPEPDQEGWKGPSSCPDVGGGSRPPWTTMLLELYLEAFGLAEATDHRFGWQKHRARQRRELLAEFMARGDVIEVHVEGVRRSYYAPADKASALADAESWHPEPLVYILSPLDNLLWSRPRIEDLWGFEYRWEIYTPVAKRQFGPYTMPILEGDMLIGRVDLRNDQAAGVLWVNILALEEGIDPPGERAERIVGALHELAAFLAAVDIKVEDGGRVPATLKRAL